MTWNGKRLLCRILLHRICAVSLGLRHISRSRYIPRMGSLEALIEDVYVAALRPERWPATLRAIAAATGSRDCVFQALRISPSGAKVVSSLGGEIDSETMSGYASLIARVGDPRVEYSIRQPVGRVYQDHHAITAAEMRRHPYYQEFMLPLGFKYAAIVFGVVERTREDFLGAGIGLQRTPRQGPLDGEPLRRFETLVPHVVRAVRVANRVAADSPQQSDDRDDPDKACVGLDARGRVLTLDESADAWLRDGRLRLGRDGRPEFANPMLNRRIEDAVAAALASNAEAPLSGRCRIAGGSVNFMVVPRPRQAWLRDEPGRAAVAVELRLRLEPFPVLAPLLTPTEERVVLRLEEGRSLRDAANDLGISYETARTHVKRIMQKLGVRSQAALVAHRFRNR
jgi:DNA-binding CsgD family transcriptional regulator